MSEQIKSDWDLGRHDDHLRQCLVFATSKYIRLEAEVAALQAENERLRKAGDDCEKALCWIVSDAFLLERMPATWAVGIDVAINRWHAAKGVQP